MLRNERNLRQRFNNRVDSYDHADAPIAGPNPAKTTLMATRGNPGFTAQFDLQILLRYFSVSGGGAYTLLTAAQLLAASSTLAQKFKAFIFGNSDYGAGFAKLQAQFPIPVYTYGVPFVYGANAPIVNGVTLDATATAQLVKGDLVIPYYATVAAVNYQAFVIIRCTQVAYGTLLKALDSDMFTMNMIRYIMADTTAVGLAQYNNNIFVCKQSLFGKFDSDFISPNSFKLPEQMQNGVIDIPLVKGIDKQIALATDVNYDVSPVQWSLFVEMVNKLAY